MKSILFSDIHLGLKKDNTIYHKVIEDLFLDIADYCIKNDIKKIICLGDFFNNRTSINTSTLYFVLEKLIKIFEDFDFFIILGNHDTFYKNTNFPHSLKIFDKHKNITIVDEFPLEIEECTLVPWGFENFSEITTPILMGHFEIQNFKMNDSSVCYSGTEEKKLKQFDHVFSGHFHTPSSNSNITYLGSPFQITFADTNSPRGFYEYNNGEIKFIEFTKYPKFFVYKYNKIDENNIQGNYIKIIFDEIISEKESCEILENVLLKNPLELSTEYIIKNENEEIKNETELTSVISTLDLYKTYFSKIEKPKFINDKILEKILVSLI